MLKDQYTEAKLSRQRKYQLRHQDKGLCIYCAAPAVLGVLCLRHAIRVREDMRKRKKCKKRFFSSSYRMEQQEQMKQRVLKALKKKVEAMENNGH